MKIKNRDELLNRGDMESKRILLDIAEETLRQLDAYSRIKALLHVEDGRLIIGKRTWDLRKHRHIYLLGAGKACNAMAMAVEEILGEYLTKGIISVKIQEEGDRFAKTKVYVGGHPTPNEEGQEAAFAMLDLIDTAGPQDLFACVVSGGSSALLGCPAEGITLSDEIYATDVLLKSGAGIRDINAVRRHISRTNGGRIAQRIAEKGAGMICLAIRDSLSARPTGDIAVPVAYTATQFGSDDTTLADARQTIRDHALCDRLPASILTHLAEDGPAEETPKAFPQFSYYVINTLPDACMIARQAAENLGINAVILSSFIEGEASEVGRVFAGIAREIHTYGHPAAAPCVLISAGEAGTRIEQNTALEGHGGPSQEMAVGFALMANKIPGAALFSIDTEGTDGTTSYAGGLTDSTTLTYAKEVGVDLHRALRVHATSEALNALHCCVLTGNTGTNLCDLNLMYVSNSKKIGN